MEEKNKNEKILEYKQKIWILLFIITMLVISYFTVGFLMPLFFPFVMALAIALLVRPVILFLHKYFRINVMVGTVVILGAISAVIAMIASFLLRSVINQILSLLENMHIYRAAADGILCNICHAIEAAIGANTDSILESVNKNINDFLVGIESKIMPIIMGTSIPAIMGFIEILIGAALMIVSLFLFVKDMDKIKEYLKGYTFKNETAFVVKKTFMVMKAYVKAQFIIMACIAAECIVGFMIMGNKYALLLGIIIGVFDALPLFGVGTVLVPWTVIYIMAGNFVNAAIVFTVFLVCYFTREFMEPKLIGDKIGINPLMTLVSIYAGYKLLGFVGMFVGPLIFIIVRDSTIEFTKFIKS